MTRRISKRQEDLITERQRAAVAELYCRRLFQSEIAEQLGIDQGTVSRHLVVLHKRWLARQDEATNRRAAEELARLDNLERIAMAAWERSCQNKETMKASKLKGRTGKRTVKSEKEGTKTTTTEIVNLPDLDKTEKIVTGQAGDPRFLERAGWCVQKRLELMGLLKPDASGGTQTVTTVVNKIDLNVVLGKEHGIPIDRIGSVQPN